MYTHAKKHWSSKTIGIFQKFAASPFTLLRAAGPIGFSLISSVRSDLGKKFQNRFEPQHFLSYVYHCNVQQASGELAFQVRFLSQYEPQPTVYQLLTITTRILILTL